MLLKDVLLLDSYYYEDVSPPKTLGQDVGESNIENDALHTLRLVVGGLRVGRKNPNPNPVVRKRADRQHALRGAGRLVNVP